MRKAILSLPEGMSSEKVVAARQRVADHLGLCLDDVLALAGVGVQIVDVPIAAPAEEPRRTALTMLEE